MKHLVHFSIASVAVLLTACANMGAGPQGGEKDVTPPKYLSSTPTPNQKNYKNKKITLTFDEYVQLKDPYNKVVVSPPQTTPVSISSLGKKVTVELGDSLIPDRTYIIDFANSISDNNEGNEIENYFISFSTGNDIDSFQISGMIIDAHTLAPMTGIYVGAYESEADSAFKKTKMDYVAKTDDKGHFSIRGLKERSYSIYALKDNNSNFKFDDKSEGIAVLGKPVRTQRIETIRHDTTFKDSTTIDTIVTKVTSKYIPDSLLMRFFTEEKHLQYYKNAVWNSKDFFILNFVNEKKELPTITPLNFKAKNWYKIEPSVTYDTLTYWISDTMVANLDTLKLAIDYQKTDSAEQFVQKRDTITLLARKWKADKKYKGPEFSVPKKIEVYDMPTITWATPVKEFDESMLVLKQKKDSTWEKVECTIKALDNPREYRLIAALEEDGQYKITVDSGKVKDLNGIANKVRLDGQFLKRSKKEYTNFELKVKNAKLPAFIELLSAKEETVRKVDLTGETAKFENLEPGDYYIRLTEDANNDGKWTTGCYDKKQEPEQVFYYPTKITLRANWDREEDWDVKEKDITKQRPTELGAQKNKNKKK